VVDRKILVVGLLLFAGIIFFVFFQGNSTSKVLSEKNLTENDLQGAGLVSYSAFDFERKLDPAEMSTLKSNLESASLSLTGEEKAKSQLYAKAVGLDLSQSTILRQLELDLKNVSDDPEQNCSKLPDLIDARTKQEALLIETINLYAEDLETSAKFKSENYLNLTFSDQELLLEHLDNAISKLESTCGVIR